MAKKNETPDTNTEAPTFTDAQNAFVRDLSGAQNAGGFLYASADVGQALAQAGLISVNPDMKDENGNLAAKLTEQGLTYAGTLTAPTGETASTFAAAKPKREFVVERGVPLGIKGKRGGRAGGSMYPFEALAAPVENIDAETKTDYPFLFDSFFVTNGAKKNMLKSMSSTVSQQNTAKAVEVKNPDGTTQMETITVRGKEVTRPVTRNDVFYVVLAAPEGDPKGTDGVRVYRVDDKMPK